jgi:beta-galactosidase
LHLLPHWNWPGREGQEIDVRALSNCQEVELFLNGQSLGRLAMKRDSELKWKVKYAPGVLNAKGYTDGKLIAETKVETAGAPAVLQLEPDRTVIYADGEDLSIIAIFVRDAQNRTVPVANNLVHFELDGPGKILGVGNGDPSCHEPDVFVPKTNLRTIAENEGWRWKILPDVRRPQLAELQPDFNDAAWEKADTQANADSLKVPQQAVYRAKISVTAADLTADSVQLKIGRIDDRGWVYINGRLAGESHDWSASPSFEIKSLLHAGGNSVAVAVINDDNAGGLGNGIALRILEKGEAPGWQRSVFNGLAQVIVQSGTAAGQIKLTATADGLAPVSVIIRSEESAPGLRHRL